MSEREARATDRRGVSEREARANDRRAVSRSLPDEDVEAMVATSYDVDGATTLSAPPTPDPDRRAVPPTRGRKQHSLGRIRSPLGLGWRLALGAIGVAAIFGAWLLLSWRLDDARSFLVPTPAAAWDAFTAMWRDGTFAGDLAASLQRVGIGYAISMAIGVVLGVLIGSFVSAESFFEPQIGFLRYIPASALTPLLLLWLGIGESPKITLIVVGTVFFNVLMVADVVRATPRELLNASATLGAGRWTTVRKVILPHSVPGMIDVARINLAAAWLMLVVAELLAAQEGLAFRIVRAQRFRDVPTMFALLITFGVIGLVSDLLLRRLRWLVAKWARP
jgi:NitT/TauT family transport system permease protein